MKIKRLVKPSDIFEEAARRIERSRNTVCCSAINLACGFRKYRNAKDRAFYLFKEYIRPRNPGIFWFGEPTSFNSDVRVVALCFAAAIARSLGE
jgi:hypothetical protein